MMFVEIDEFDICVILGMWFIIFYNFFMFFKYCYVGRKNESIYWVLEIFWLI